ncbi:zinc ribbon domain-containing protein [bacterium]|nr:zinc ribbon domain-containing protein [bacterium]
MPIYEYQCEDCGKQFELLIRNTSENNEPKCIHCGSPKIVRKLSAFAVKNDSGSSSSSCPTGTCPYSS